MGCYKKMLLLITGQCSVTQSEGLNVDGLGTCRRGAGCRSGEGLIAKNAESFCDHLR